MTDDLDVLDGSEDDPPTEGGMTLFGDDREFHTTWREWQGMPEMNQREIRPFGSIMVHFATDDDRRAFERLVGQEIILPSLRGIWFPKQVIGHFVDKRYRDESVPTGDDVPGPTYLGGTAFKEPGSVSISESTGARGRRS